MTGGIIHSFAEVLSTRPCMCMQNKFVRISWLRKYGQKFDMCIFPRRLKADGCILDVRKFTFSLKSVFMMDVRFKLTINDAWSCLRRQM